MYGRIMYARMFAEKVEVNLIIEGEHPEFQLTMYDEKSCLEVTLPIWIAESLFFKLEECIKEYQSSVPNTNEVEKQ